MKRVLCILSAACLVLSLAACGKGGLLDKLKPKKEPEKFSVHSFEYFDTATTITGYAENKEAFDKIADQALALLGEYHRLYDIYTPTTTEDNLYAVNDVIDGAHPTVKVDRRIIDLLVYAREMHDKTNGLTNIAMGSVLKWWHDYRSVGMDDPAKAAIPSMDVLRQASKHTDITKMVIDEEKCTVTLTDPQMRLDVGAIAKGYATEQVARWLEKKGVSGWLLNVGGNIRAVGKKPDGSAWTAGLEDPRNLSGDYLEYLQLSHEALVTSGSYQRYYVVDGKRYHHIIHPDTLMPAEGLLSVSVICADSGMADALSTALFCLSVEDGQALVKSIKGVEALWMTAEGKKIVSDGWNQFVKK